MLTKQLNHTAMHKLLIFIFLAISSTGLSAQSPISLEECIEQSLEANPYAKNKQILSEIQKIEDETIKTAFFPQSNILGRASWQSEVSSLPIELPNIDVPTVPKDQYKIYLDVNQLIFDGGSINALRKDKAILSKISQAQQSTKEYHLKNQISTWYYRVVLADRLVENLDLVIKEIGQSKTRLEAAIINGVAINQDLLKLRAKELEIKQNKNEIIAGRSSTIAALAIWMGEDAHVLEQKSFDDPIEVEQGMQEIQRPELELFALQRESTFAKENLISKSNNPMLSANFMGGYGRPGLNFLSDQFDLYATVGLNLKVPLTNYYSGKSKKDAQVVGLRRMQIDEEERVFVNQVSAQQKASQIQIQKLKDWIVLDKESLEIKEEILSISKAQWENGVITTTEYLREMNQRDIAKQNQIVHVVNLGQAFYELRYVTGN